jgi:carbon storage regulator CsrA
MLILTRKAGQAACVGSDVGIVVAEIRGRQVHIGIETPAKVKLYREEISDAEREQYRIGGDD